MAAIPFQPMMESRPIREIAYEVLKHAIITGEIPAGERIVETEYADRLHISRTPLREALRKLERDGLVVWTAARRDRPRVHDCRRGGNLHHPQCAGNADAACNYPESDGG